MRRNGSNWLYFLTLILAGIMTLALLPACGGGGGGESCNTEATNEADEPGCELEEVDEEELLGEEEIADEEDELTHDEDEAESELDEEIGFDAPPLAP